MLRKNSRLDLIQPAIRRKRGAVAILYNRASSVYDGAQEIVDQYNETNKIANFTNKMPKDYLKASDRMFDNVSKLQKLCTAILDDSEIMYTEVAGYEVDPNK